MTAKLAKPGVSIHDVTIDTGLPTLRDRSVAWLVKAFDEMNDRDLIRKVRISIECTAG